MAPLLSLAATASVLFAAAPQSGTPVEVWVSPASTYVEQVKATQHLSFDFILTNRASVPLRVSSVRLSVFDKSAKLLLSKFSENGLSASLQAPTMIPAGQKILLMNPFATFPAEVKLDKLAYEIVLRDEEGEKEYTVRAEVRPRPYKQRTPLSLPVDGRLVVYVGHDFYAHHRRVDLTHPFVAQLGVKTNPTRFAYDFCVSDGEGKLFKTDGKAREEWLGWEAPILAPADGRVMETRNDVEDNVFGKTMFDPSLALKDIKSFFGNYVAIQHRGGEVSVLAHLRKGSVRVQSGQQVRRGQEIARMGLSGDSEYVHLHYQLQEGFDLNSETLPAAFSGFDWLLGGTRMRIRSGALESGDFVQRRR